MPSLINFCAFLFILYTVYIGAKLKDFKKVSKISLWLTGFIYYPLIGLTCHSCEQVLVFQFLLPIFYIAVGQTNFYIILINIFLLYGIDWYNFIKDGQSLNHTVCMTSVFLIISIGTLILIRALIRKLNYAIEDKEKLVEHYKKIARLDPLTLLYNRFGLEESMVNDHVIDNVCYCVMMDLDNFSQVNNENGHDEGDRVLKALADILKKYIEEKKLYIGRFGGEEFIMWSFMTLTKTQIICEQIRKEVENIPRKHGKRKATKMSISIGISKRGYFGDATKKQADDHLYYAKSLGKNQVCSRILKKM